MTNFKNFKQIIKSYGFASEISVTDLHRMRKDMKKAFEKEPSAALKRELTLILMVLKELRTDKICPCCKRPLYLSDLPQYEYVCPVCDENFFAFEALTCQGPDSMKIAG